MKAVFLDCASVGPGLDMSPLYEILPDLTIFDATDDTQVADRIRDAEFVFVNKTRVTEKLMRIATRLRFIGLTATGTDNVDLAGAGQHDVAVCNIRGYCTQSVAEHVFGMLLMLTHNLGRYSADIRAGEWQRSPDFCMLNHQLQIVQLASQRIEQAGPIERGDFDDRTLL